MQTWKQPKHCFLPLHVARTKKTQMTAASFNCEGLYILVFEGCPAKSIRFLGCLTTAGVCREPGTCSNHRGDGNVCEQGLQSSTWSCTDFPNLRPVWTRCFNLGQNFCTQATAPHFLLKLKPLYAARWLLGRSWKGKGL